jgi:putative spermidine/putrescine transport system ATP-binding protein
VRQQQRVAIARALVFQPSLLLLDEPLAALDKKLREEMQLEFRRIQRELGVTTINVTHDQREALVMSDRIMIMNEGRLQQFDTPIDAYRKPHNRFVADFVGVTNFLNARVVAENGDVALDVGGRNIGAAQSVVPAPSVGDQVECAIRAEQVRIDAADMDTEVAFDGQVEEAIFEGERVIYVVRVAALGDVSLRAIRHHADRDTILAPGQPARIGWMHRDLHVFRH